MSRKINKKAIKFANKGKTKDRNTLIHMIRRFQERFGITVGLGDIEDIMTQIKTGTANLLSMSSKGHIYRIRLKDRDMIVVLDRYNSQIVTVLPEDNEYYKKQSARTCKDVPYMMHVLHKYKMYLRQKNGINEHPIYCDKCGSSKLYSDLDDFSIVCHKCGYRFDTESLADRELEEIQITEKDRVTSAVQLNRSLYAILLSSGTEQEFNLCDHRFVVTADLDGFIVNHIRHKQLSWFIIYESGNVKVISNEEYEKHYIQKGKTHDDHSNQQISNTETR